jgi:regulatory protein
VADGMAEHLGIGKEPEHIDRRSCSTTTDIEWFGLLYTRMTDRRVRMHITALQPQANDPNRVNIFVDDRFYMGVYALIVLKLGLKVRQELTPELQQALKMEEARQKAIDRAMNYLSFRPRSSEEVRRYLRKKENPPELIDDVLARLTELGLINDEAFASFWIESRERFRPKGAQAIKQELRMKGVKRDVVDEVVNDDNDEALAIQAGRKRAITLLKGPELDFNTFRNKLGPFLQRRGFSYEVVKRVVRMLWEELATDSATNDD